MALGWAAIWGAACSWTASGAWPDHQVYLVVYHQFLLYLVLIASLVVQSIENLTRIHERKRWLQLHQDGRIAALMVAYCLQLHLKDQHFHEDEILESLVEVPEANSLVVEHLEN